MTGLGAGPSNIIGSLGRMSDALNDAMIRRDMAAKKKITVDVLKDAYTDIYTAAGDTSAVPSSGFTAKRPLIDLMVDKYGIPSKDLYTMITSSSSGKIDPTQLAAYFPAPAPAPAPAGTSTKQAGP